MRKPEHYLIILKLFSFSLGTVNIILIILFTPPSYLYTWQSIYIEHDHSAKCKYGRRADSVPQVLREAEMQMQ